MGGKRLQNRPLFAMFSIGAMELDKIGQNLTILDNSRHCNRGKVPETEPRGARPCTTHGHAQLAGDPTAGTVPAVGSHKRNIFLPRNTSRLGRSVSYAYCSRARARVPINNTTAEVSFPRNKPYRALAEPSPAGVSADCLAIKGETNQLWSDQYQRLAARMTVRLAKMTVWFTSGRMAPSSWARASRESPASRSLEA